MNTTSLDLMEDLITAYQELFNENSSLPPDRNRSHWIRLLTGTGVVAVRPYRYAHDQKDELERQCAMMLEQGII